MRQHPYNHVASFAAIKCVREVVQSGKVPGWRRIVQSAWMLPCHPPAAGLTDQRLRRIWVYADPRLGLAHFAVKSAREIIVAKNPRICSSTLFAASIPS
jgi:hypothetical protein